MPAPSIIRVCRQSLLLICFIISFLTNFSAAGKFLNDDQSEALVTLESRQSLVTQTAKSGFWMEVIKRQGTIPYESYSVFAPNASYPVFRNVKAYGAKGDGVTDDTAAIQAAVYDGSRCNYPCPSSTVRGALIYFPAGTYMVSQPIALSYNTQMVGDATNLPVIKGVAGFQGGGLFDSDKYNPTGGEGFQNQNNFYREIRNFIFDLTISNDNARGLHWQVAQATSLQNLVFKLKDNNPTNKQWGIFMDNGSANMLGDIVVYGGQYGAFMGNQQFTARNLTFYNSGTAIYQNWGWTWAYKNLQIHNCTMGFNMTSGAGQTQAIGLISIQDAVFDNVDIGILTTFGANSTPASGGSLHCDNCDFRTSRVAIQSNLTVVVPGGSIIPNFMQGRAYSAYDGQKQYTNNKTCHTPLVNSARIQQTGNQPPRPAQLLDVNGRIPERPRPQYENVPVSSFVSVKDNGAVGDGLTDDTAAIQRVLSNVNTNQIVYFDHGAYLISDTIQVPKNIKITGEMWPMIMVDGSSSKFNDMTNPQVAWRVGNPGDVGNVEMSELIFETRGAAPGAIITEWNVAGTTPGAAGMWEVHWRIGGTAGTLLQEDHCAKNPSVVAPPDPNCIGAFLLLHLTSTASVYMENNWGWVSDHELDMSAKGQINIYNGRGLLIESQLGIWMYGSSFEHSQMYNYQVANAKYVYMSIIQSETAYMQDNPNAQVPFPVNLIYSDPDFKYCYNGFNTCYKTWGLRVYNSTYVYSHGAGLYSFFDNYDSTCLITHNCQVNTLAIEQSEAVYIYGLATVGVDNMVQVDGSNLVSHTPNPSIFTDGIIVFEYP